MMYVLSHITILSDKMLDINQAEGVLQHRETRISFSQHFSGPNMLQLSEVSYLFLQIQIFHLCCFYARNSSPEIIQYYFRNKGNGDDKFLKMDLIILKKKKACFHQLLLNFIARKINGPHAEPQKNTAVCHNPLSIMGEYFCL